MDIHSEVLIETPDDLYREIMKVTKPDEVGHWISDLQCKVTHETQALIKRYKYKKLVTRFISAIDGTDWYEIPFAYTPYWDEKIGGQ